MKCTQWDSHKYTVDEVDEDSFKYTGSFDVIATAQGAVLIEKRYRTRCPECRSGTGSKGYLYKDRLEMVAHDNLPLTEEV
ncbi:hypothetical protein M199_gp223 [Halogranum tailed virus 1]|uniref:Uncharacterized protein n=1 Tax=Halogranum tailed virus 1 TaxID=1273749 RepID=R4TMP5_9CAUD|nr:hypothetical protein M199_gp223 [Halogranum tailed virus 1]AGM11443.1 hypothetical protein HGTV1_146 [Halogranum tailed virus 1]